MRVITWLDMLFRFQEKAGNNALLAASAPFTVQDRCKLDADEACYVSQSRVLGWVSCEWVLEFVCGM